MFLFSFSFGGCSPDSTINPSSVLWILNILNIKCWGEEKNHRHVISHVIHGFSGPSLS